MTTVDEEWEKFCENEEQFLADGGSYIRNNKNKRKGIIVQFLNNGEPYYEYPPVDILEK